MVREVSIEPPRRRGNGAAGLALLMVAAAVTGLRPLPAVAQQNAQGEVKQDKAAREDESPEAGAPAVTDPVQLMASTEIAMIVDVDIEQLRQSPQIKPLLAQRPAEMVERLETLLGVPLENVQRITVGFSNPTPSMPLGQYAHHVVTYMDVDAADSVGAPDAVVEELADALQSRHVGPEDSEAPGARVAPRMTLHGSDWSLAFESIAFRAPPAADSIAGQLIRFDPNDGEATKPPVRVALDMKALHPAIQGLLKESRDQGGPTMAGLEPLMVDVDAVLLAMTAEQLLKVEARFDCPSPEAAERVAEMLPAVRGLAAHLLRREFERSLDRRTRIMVSSLVSAGRRLVESLEFTTRGASVTVQGQVDAPQMLAMAGMALPALVEAQQAQSINNLEQIGLAFHNYHAAHGHFPSAVVEGPGGVTRSWRVELLPFLGAADLYERYRTDEPWDSENNLQVLKEIPPVFRHPRQWAVSTDTRYLTIVGEGTALSGKQPKIRNFTDGVSNTILAVESSRGVPWTQPDDLPFDPEALLAGRLLPGEIVVLVGDGWAGKLSDQLTPDELRKMITRAGGEPATPPDEP